MPNEVEISLDNVIIGSKIRMFQSNDETFYSMKPSSFNKSDDLLLKENDLKYNYFMRGNKNIKLNTSYDENFINEAKINLSGNIGTNEIPAVYYEKELDSLDAKDGSNIIQFGHKYYFINSNQFLNKPASNHHINGKYDIETKISVKSKISVKNYISKRYNANFYENSLIYVDDKSVPIYDLSPSALSLIQVLKFKNTGIISSIIREFDLSEIQDKILYSSKIDSLSLNQYDSLFIPPIIDFIIERDDEKSQTMLKKFFDFIFSNLSIESFYRLLIPVGKMSTVSNYKVNGASSNLNEYTYYINVNNISSLQNNIEFNYFSLKTLKNPHNEYDYNTFEVNKNESCESSMYDFMSTNEFNILNFVNSTINQVKELLDNSHAGVLSGTYINEHNLVPGMVDASLDFYGNWSRETIERSINNESSWMRNVAFLRYFKSKYDKDLNKEPYLIGKDEMVYFILNKTNEYNNLYQGFMEEDSTLSSLYYDGLTMLGEINNSFACLSNENNPFLLKKPVLLLKRSNLSATFSRKLEKFKRGIVKPLAKTILNKCERNDYNFASQFEWYSTRFKDRFSTKINDYYNSYNDYFSHENLMKKDGVLFGYRQYNIINTSLNNRIYLTYNYLTSYDEKFLEKNDLLNDVEIINNQYIDSLEFSKSNKSKKSLDELINDPLIIESAKIRLNNNFVLKLNEKLKINNFLSYYKMLDELKTVEFIDYIEGFNKYKKTDATKSNVYSIELVNSNLNYELISFNEMIKILSEHGYNYDEETDNDTFIEAVHNIGYMEILDSTINTDIEILSKMNFIIPISSYKFYIPDKPLSAGLPENPLNKNLKTKMEMRKQVEQAIRKSIHRYAPANTTLWKIKYSGI